MPDNKVHIIGVGPGGAASLLPATYQILQAADMVIGGARLLAMFPSLPGERVVIGHNLPEVAAIIRDNLNQKRMAVLASGDPGFYGVARYLTGQLGKDAFEIIPNLSAMQLAFARIKESWDDAALASVHSRPVADIVALVRAHAKVGLFTDDKHGPGEIAGVLREQGVADCRAYVCQDLGSQHEAIVATNLYRLPGMTFSPLNTVILIQDNPPEPARPRPGLGIADSEFERRQEGLITKLEVRAVSLAKMGLREDSLVWDIGAGSGAISVEAACLAGQGTVFAVEKDPRSVADIRANIRRFGAGNVRVVAAPAPEGLAGLPDPDAVFVGGSGGQLEAILETSCRRLKPAGRLVINAATLETLHRAVAALKASGFTAEVTSVNIARSQDVAGLTRLQAVNPVFIITGGRAGGLEP